MKPEGNLSRDSKDCKYEFFENQNIINIHEVKGTILLNFEIDFASQTLN